MTNLLLTLYKLMLRLYPSRFYNTFGPEMTDVFAEKLSHTGGNMALLTVFGRELWYLPINCLREHWAAQQVAFNFPTYEKLSWLGTAVAALPFLLIALVFAALTYVPNQNIFNFAILGVLFIGLMIAWWQHWPDWSASWLGFLAFIVAYILLPQFIMQVGFVRNPVGISLVIPTLVLFFAFYWLVGRWPRVGAVSMLLPIGFSWLLQMEFVPQNLTTLIHIFTWAWLAVTVVLLTRLVPQRGHGWVLGLAALVIGLFSAFAGQFWVDIPPLSHLMENFLSEFVPTLLPLVAVLLLHALRRRLVVGNGRTALRSYQFLFWGIVGVIFAGQMVVQMAASVGVTAVFLLSLLGIGLGTWRLRHSQPVWLLLALVALFPFLYQAGTIGSWLLELPLLRSSDEILYETVQLGSQVLGLIWLVLAAWLLGRIAPPQPEEPSGELAQGSAS